MHERKQQRQTGKARSPFWWLRWIPILVLLFLLFKFLFLFVGLVLVPLLLSLTLAYLLYPLVAYLEKRGLPRSWATVCTLVLMTLTLIVLLNFVLPQLVEQGIAATQKLLLAFNPESAAEQRLWLRRYSPLLDRLLGARLEQVWRNPMEAIGSPALWAVGGLSGFFATALASLDLPLVPFFVYYILMDFGAWRSHLEDWVPPRFRTTFSRLLDEISRLLAAYVRGQVLIALIMVGLYSIGFAVCRVPAWAGIAALAGLLNIIPYVGTGLGLILALAFTLTDGGMSWRLIGVIGVFSVVQVIEAYILTPRIIGARVSLHPLAVILGLLIGGKLFGLLGLILAVPTIAITKVFLLFIRELYQGSYFYHAGDIHPSQAPSEVLEIRLTDAAEAVLPDQNGRQQKDEASEQKENAVLQEAGKSPT